ncbi:MAG: YceH family protein [Dokdonella sp.]
MENEIAKLLEPLNPIEARILGCLVEKAAITPEVYPLTVNAIVAASNQKTSREPLMHLEPGAVAHALRVMENRGLVKVAPASQRALRYEHRFDTTYGVTARQRAVLCVMLLRGPQTLAELLTRTDRLAEFPGLDDVRDTLDRMIQREPAFAVRLGRGSGQREDRYMHLLCGPVSADAFASATPTPASATRSDVNERIARLEAEVETLRDELAGLHKRLDTLADPDRTPQP